MLTKFIIALLLSLGLTVSVDPIAPPSVASAESKTAIEQQHSTTHRIAVFDLFQGQIWNEEVGHCSGTIVGRHSLLTANHCFMDSNLIRLDAEKEPTVILAAFVDGQDHIIYILDRTFTSWASISERSLVPGEAVHMWAAPGHNTDVYRSGYFKNLITVKELDPDMKINFELFILPIFKGDSGSALFDENGSIIAVTSLGNESAEGLDLPLSFTQAQLDAATK